MTWRVGLTLVLLLAAIACGWSVWTHSGGGIDAAASTRSDYVLHDFEIVSLDSQGEESFTLRGPRLQRDPGAKSMTCCLPTTIRPYPLRSPSPNSREGSQPLPPATARCSRSGGS